MEAYSALDRRKATVSISFYGLAAGRRVVALDFEARLSLSREDACSWLKFLGLESGDGREPYGEVTMHDVRRALMRVGNGSVSASRLADFESFINAVVEKGAISIYWTYSPDINERETSSSKTSDEPPPCIKTQAAQG